jgi:hypothetical protein
MARFFLLQFGVREFLIEIVQNNFFGFPFGEGWVKITPIAKSKTLQIHLKAFDWEGIVWRAFTLFILVNWLSPK